MAVDLGDIALDLRLIPSLDAPLAAGHASILTRHLGAAEAIVDGVLPSSTGRFGGPSSQLWIVRGLPLTHPQTHPCLLYTSPSPRDS